MSTWHTGQDWRVVGGLNKLNEQIRAYAPRSVPPATDVNSWGSIADNEHSTSSDHYPHYYGALGSTAVVCARDFPHAPNLGLDGGVVTEHMRVARDSRVQYIIFNRRITGVNYGWAWHSYDGDDPHDTHFHVSTVHTAVADGTQAWSLPGGTPAAPSIGATGMEIFTITAVPAGGTDVTGAPLTEGGQYFVTPRGLFSLSGDEFFSQPAAIQPNRMKMVYPRALALAAAMNDQAIDIEQLATEIAAHYPQSEIDQAKIVAALQSEAGQQALEQAAATGAAYAEDH